MGRGQQWLVARRRDDEGVRVLLVGLRLQHHWRCHVLLLSLLHPAVEEASA